MGSVRPGDGAPVGSPGAGDGGITSGIVITVSDGSLSASLPAFALTVQAIALGSATLSWTAPTQNTDGSPPTNLAGYRIYWGTQQRGDGAQQRGGGERLLRSREQDDPVKIRQEPAGRAEAARYNEPCVS